jgi:hypothetical protein
MFPKKTLSRPCSEYEVDWGRNFWAWGSRHIKGSYCLIYGCLCGGCVGSLRLQCNIFPSPLFAFHFFMVRTLSAMCKERKRAPQRHLKLEHIECHMHWKLKDIAMHSPIKRDILFIFFLKGPPFFMEKHFIALRTLGRASRRIEYGF